MAQQGNTPFGVYVTSPDYLGGVQDIPALAAVCRAQGVPLLVDNAHGAYLRFLPQNCHPIAQGAAMCCDSAHKTLPVVTGGAYLHLAHGAPVQDEAAVRGALALFGSTSPSYLILQSLDACNAVLAGDYPQRLSQCCAALEGLRRSLNKVAAARQCPVPLAVAGAQQEPMKLTLDAAALGCTGTALAGVCRLAAAGGAALYHPAGGAGCTGACPGAQGTGTGVCHAYGILPARHPCGGQRRGDHPGGHRPDAALRH